MTQRRLAVDGGAAAPAAPTRPEPGTARPPAAPPPDELEGPSDRGLRERQRRWQRERARFERAESVPDAGAGPGLPPADPAPGPASD